MDTVRLLLILQYPRSVRTPGVCFPHPFLKIDEFCKEKWSDMSASVSVIKNILEICLKKQGEFYKLAEDCFFPAFLMKKEFLQVQGTF